MNEPKFESVKEIQNPIGGPAIYEGEYQGKNIRMYFHWKARHIHAYVDKALCLDEHMPIETPGTTWILEKLIGNNFEPCQK